MAVASFVAQKKTGVLIECRVTPRSAKRGIRGEKGGLLLVGLSCPPAGGRANQELVEIISKALRVPKSCVAITKGLQSRVKTVFVQDVAVEQVTHILNDFF